MMPASPTLRCAICYDAWRAEEAPRGIHCPRGHFVDGTCLALFARHELDMVRLAKSFGVVACPDPGCAGPDGGVAYAEEQLCAVLGGVAHEHWRSFVAARAAAPLRLTQEQPPTEPLVRMSPQLTAVEPWLRCLEIELAEGNSPVQDARTPPLHLWACRGLGGGDGNDAGSAGGLGVQLWPAAISLAARAATYAEKHHSVCDLGCGVGLVGLSWLHAAASASPGTDAGADARRRLVLTDADDECLALARCNIQSLEQQHASTMHQYEEPAFDARTAVLRWGDADAARSLAQQQEGIDLILGTDLLYFAGAEVAQRLALTIATLLSPLGLVESAACSVKTQHRCAVLANHAGWFNEHLEQCLRDSAVSVH